MREIDGGWMDGWIVRGGFISGREKRDLDRETACPTKAAAFRRWRYSPRESVVRPSGLCPFWRCT